MRARAKRHLLVIAHRGASARAPENTAAAVKLALRDGARAIECDVQLARDGVPIVFHDSDLARLCGEAVRVGDLDARTLVRKRVEVEGRRGRANRVLTLAAWLALLPRNVLPVVELKRQPDGRAERALAEAAAAVLRRRRGPLAVISFAPGLVRRMRRLLPAAQVAAIRDRLPSGAARTRMLADPATLLVTSKALARGDFVDAVRTAGKELWCYTVDAPEEMRILVARGVTGIITNRPDLALRALQGVRP